MDFTGKKDRAITVHMCEDLYRIVTQLSELEAPTASEYLCNLAIERVQIKECDYTLLKDIFGGNSSNNSNNSGENS